MRTEAVLKISKRGVCKGDTVVMSGHTLEFPCTLVGKDAKLARHLVAAFARECGFKAEVKYTKVIITKEL
jgi:hypothetical protein